MPVRFLLSLIIIGIIAAGCAASPATKVDTVKSPSASASASPSTRPSNRYTSRIPAFRPAPTPIPITVPAGNRALALNRVPTSQPVAFLTIDDGWVRRPEAIELLKAANIPVTLFLLSPVAAQDPAFFRAMQANGARIESHTVNHESLAGRSLAFQRQEICDSSAKLGELFGQRSTLFRPPFGEYDDTTLIAARQCGIKAVFHWTQAVNGGHVYYQTEEKEVKPGDVILMHFREAYVADFLAALKAIHASGLTPALLEDYVR